MMHDSSFMRLVAVAANLAWWPTWPSYFSKCSGKKEEPTFACAKQACDSTGAGMINAEEWVQMMRGNL
ncbi:predicted protein [Sclerotinia sclerotiorum 1980 UF-70]|uniref:EF-hand domain-containing protein n=1 Tax=Sclerotinia sclerotiorum (strain ATCC 18683 / 1980 / Ss-1) TaxID=665079 RepID=A7EKA4_SCLS1|nr:predicted protein [Sclerotinia sclerotiorum 1980 UF-70]EDO03270.1 predicted protein [Sclerotinia sclerotiorum 1980 UF-70]